MIHTILNILKHIFALYCFSTLFPVFGISIGDLTIGSNNTPTPNFTDVNSVLALIENTLLWGVLPVVVVGASLYTAYKLFTAEGDAPKLKEAWKTVIYTAVGIIITLLAYAMVKIVSTLQVF